MSKEPTITLDEELLNEFSSKIEETINSICEKYPDLDPRLELLVSLGMFFTQVGIDSGYDRKEFITLITEMFDSSQEDEQPKHKKNDISKFN